MRAFLWLSLMGLLPVSAAELAKGDAIQLTLRGVAPSEQSQVTGDYTVDDSGRVRLPLLEDPVPAIGLSPAGFARRAEAAYRAAGIYTQPAIEVVALKNKEAVGAVVSVGGCVKSDGEVAFRQGLTVLQALNAAGGLDPFAGRNVMLMRAGKQYCLDFKQLAHKNIELEANDTLQVEQRPALLDRWKGSADRIAILMK